MQRIAILVFILCVVHANAIYVSTSLGDSRLQDDNQIYKPGGILHVSLEAGFFDEPENAFDYKLAFGIDRFGYSHSDGEVSVSFWEVYFKPVVLSGTGTKYNIMLEFAPYVGWLIAASNLTEKSDSIIFATRDIKNRFILGYEYRLGYQINKAFLVSITANYHWISPYGLYKKDFESSHISDDPLMGGWGLNFQYNLPW